MSREDSISRRQFLGRTAALGTAVTAAMSAEQLRSQLNNGVRPLPEEINVGFIGTGVRGTELLQASRRIAGINTLVACDLYTGHLERARELTGGVIETTGQYEDVLSRGDLDAVVLAVPDHSHKRILLDSLSAGKHVYQEKPLTHEIEEGDEMISAVDRSGKAVQVGSQTLAAGCIDRARELVRDGRLGKVTMIEAKMLRYSSLAACYYPIPPDAGPSTVDWDRFLGDAPRREFDAKRFFQWRLFWDYSGGLTTDLFVHLVSAAHYIMDVRHPDSVTGIADIYYWKNYREVPDQITALVSYPEEFVLKLTTTVNNGHPEPMMVIYGTEGTLEYNGGSMKLYHEPPREGFRYAMHSWPEATQEKYREIMRLDEELRPLGDMHPQTEEPMEFTSPDAEDPTTAHLRNFYDSVRGAASIKEDIRFGVDAVNVGHMINIACREGRTVRWDSGRRRIKS